MLPLLFLDHDVIIVGRVGLVVALDAVVLKLVGIWLKVTAAPHITGHRPVNLLASR